MMTDDAENGLSELIKTKQTLRFLARNPRICWAFHKVSSGIIGVASGTKGGSLGFHLISTTNYAAGRIGHIPCFHMMLAAIFETLMCMCMHRVRQTV